MRLGEISLKSWGERVTILKTIQWLLMVQLWSPVESRINLESHHELYNR